jgi:cytochrome b
MPKMRNSMTALNTHKTFWNAPARLLHWLTAGSLLGATILTTHGDISHTAYGIIVLATLMMQFVGRRSAHTRNLALWLVTAAAIMLNLSGWLEPEGSFHMTSTLFAMVLAALYSATVLFESMQRIATRYELGQS